jgi:hypothetical protein
MTEHLTLNTVIHAAVRRDIFRFQQALAAFPIGSRERAAQLEMAWQNLDHQLYHHHHGEETIFWPALRELGADESLVGDLGGEHERLAEAMTLTRNAMSALASDPSAANVDRARALVCTLRGCWTMLIRMPARSYGTRFRDRRCSCCPGCSVAPIRESPPCGNECIKIDYEFSTSTFQVATPPGADGGPASCCGHCSLASAAAAMSPRLRLHRIHGQS